MSLLVNGIYRWPSPLSASSVVLVLPLISPPPAACPLVLPLLVASSWPLPNVPEWEGVSLLLVVRFEIEALSPVLSKRDSAYILFCLFLGGIGFEVEMLISSIKFTDHVLFTITSRSFDITCAIASFQLLLTCKDATACQSPFICHCWSPLYNCSLLANYTPYLVCGRYINFN